MSPNVEVAVRELGSQGQFLSTESGLLYRTSPYARACGSKALSDDPWLRLVLPCQPRWRVLHRWIRVLYRWINVKCLNLSNTRDRITLFKSERAWDQHHPG